MGCYRSFLLGVAALSLALATMGADSCSTGKETKNTVEGGENAGKRAKLGDPLTLEGFSGKEKMQITPTNVLDPLQVGQFDSPTANGSRFVGVDVTLKNVGQKTYSDSPSNGAKLVTAGNQQGDSTIVSEGPCSGGFASDATISPDSTLKGCIPFEVPGKQPVKTFQFSLASGFGPQSGEWTVN